MQYLVNDCEQAIIGCILMDNSKIYQAVSVISENDFKDPVNRIIFRKLKELILEKKLENVDAVLLKNSLPKEKNIHTKYLVDCINQTPSSASIGGYFGKVKENSTKLSLQNFFSVSGKEVQSCNGDFRKWMDRTEYCFKNIMESYRKQDIKKASSPSEYAQETRELYKNYKDNPNTIRGIKTGFDRLDRVMKGLKPLNILSASTGIGKTAIALNMAENISLMQGKHILYINYEMEKEDLIRRIVSSVSEIESDRILYGKYNNGEWENVNEIINLIETMGTLHITGNEPKDINTTCSLIHHYKNKHNIEVVFIDYLGEIEPDNLAISEKQEYLTYGRYTQTLKNVCSQLDIKCVLLAQLGRTGEDKPKRANIQGSWKIPQKSDVFLILYYDEKNENYTLKIDKQRHGIYPFEISYTFKKQIHKFKEIESNPF